MDAVSLNQKNENIWPNLRIIISGILIILIIIVLYYFYTMLFKAKFVQCTDRCDPINDALWAKKDANPDAHYNTFIYPYVATDNPALANSQYIRGRTLEQRSIPDHDVKTR